MRARMRWVVVGLLGALFATGIMSGNVPRAQADRAAEPTAAEGTPQAMAIGGRGARRVRPAADASPIEAFRAAYPGIALGRVASPLDGVDVERRVSDHAAVVRSGDGPKQLMLASVPLWRSDGGERQRVDLDVINAGGWLGPRAGATDVRFGSSAANGMRIGSVGLNLDGARPVEGEVANAKAFYAGVQRGTDLVALATPTGAEFFSVLRSSDSPETQRFKLSIPSGARARQVGDHVVVSRGDDVVAKIAADWAGDAAGKPVPVSLELSGDMLTITARHRALDVTYPVIIDPTITVSDGANWYDSAQFATGSENLSSPGAAYDMFRGADYDGRGLYVFGRLGTNYPFVSWAYWRWSYRASTPSNDSTQLTQASIYRPIIETGWSRPDYPEFWLKWGIEGQGWQHRGPSCSGYRCGENYTYDWFDATSPAASSSKAVRFGLVSNFGGVPSSSFRPKADTTGFRVVLSDPENPSAPTVTGADETWTNASQPAVGLKASDPGLGIKRMTTWPQANTAATKTITEACLDPFNPCPQETPRRTVTWDGLTTDGVYPFEARAEDGKGAVSATTQYRVRVDRTAPLPTRISGSAVQATIGAGVYRVGVEGDDAQAVPQTSGARSVPVKLDGFTQGTSPTSVAGCDENCTVRGGVDLDTTRSATDFGADAFSGASTALENHTPQAGGAWTLHPTSTAPARTTAAGRVRRNGGSSTSSVGIYTLTSAPPSADYAVSADFHIPPTAANDEFATLVWRANASAKTYYEARLNVGNGRGVWTVARWSGGTKTVLWDGASYPTVARGASARAIASMQGNEIKFWTSNGIAQTISSAAIATAGRAGLSAGTNNGTSATTDDQGVQLDNFRIRPIGLEEGIHEISAVTVDGATNRSAATTRSVVVDRSSPRATLSGTLTDNDGHVGAGVHTLRIDGDDASPSGAAEVAGVDRFEIAVTDGTSTWTEPSLSPDANGDATYLFDTARYPQGTYTVTVRTYDRAKSPSGGDANSPDIDQLVVSVGLDGFDPEITDVRQVYDQQRLESNTSPDRWVVEFQGAFRTQASDVGRGLAQLELTEPLAFGGPTARNPMQRVTSPLTHQPCDGRLPNTCPIVLPHLPPYQADDDVGYSTASWKQGIVQPSMRVLDADDNASDPFPAQRKTTFEMAIDHTAPRFRALTGDLAAYRNRTITQRSTQPLQLTATAYDGEAGADDTKWESGVKFMRVELAKNIPYAETAPTSFPQRYREQDEAAPCSATFANCEHTRTFSISPGDLPEGRHAIRLEAGDRLAERTPTSRETDRRAAHLAGETFVFAVDYTPPEIEVGGELVEAGTAPLRGDIYNVWVDADDKAAGTTQSGVRSIALSVRPSGGTWSQVAYVEDPCPNGDCDNELEWDLDRDEYGPGTYEIRAATRDWAGHETTHQFPITIATDREPEPPASERATRRPSDMSAAGSGPGCATIADTYASPDLESVANGLRGTTGYETTLRFADGTYRVIRCTLTGQFVISQLVGPVAMPDGTYMLVTGITRPHPTHADSLLTAIPEYVPPELPGWAAKWAQQKAAVLANVFPPTGE